MPIQQTWFWKRNWKRARKDLNKQSGRWYKLLDFCSNMLMLFLFNSKTQCLPLKLQVNHIYHSDGFFFLTHTHAPVRPWPKLGCDWLVNPVPSHACSTLSRAHSDYGGDQSFRFVWVWFCECLDGISWKQLQAAAHGRWTRLPLLYMKLPIIFIYLLIIVAGTPFWIIPHHFNPCC